MKLHHLTIGCFCVLLSITGYAKPITLQIDNTHSSIQFTVPFLGLSEVTGRFERFCGIFVYDETDLSASRMELFIDGSSINTGLKIRDRDLVEKYLQAKNYPIIYFKSKSIRSIKNRQFEVIGDLLLHGITKKLNMVLVAIGDQVNEDQVREMGIKLQGLAINRTLFGVLDQSPGSITIGDTVTVSAVIRVRDVTSYRKEIDELYPEKRAQVTVPFGGNFQGRSGEHITLIQDKGNYFIAFSDEDWNWFAQAKVVGTNLYKLLSFSTLIEIKSDKILFTRTGEEPEELMREELK